MGARRSALTSALAKASAMTRPGHASVMPVGPEMIAATKLAQATALVWADATRDSASVQRPLLEMTAQARLATTNAMAMAFAEGPLAIASQAGQARSAPPRSALNM